MENVKVISTRLHFEDYVSFPHRLEDFELFDLDHQGTCILQGAPLVGICISISCCSDPMVQNHSLHI